MSKRAEQKAKEYEKSLDYYHYTSDNPSVAYQKGYEQAEKDLALTWETIKEIDFFLNNAPYCERTPFYERGESFYGEVLRRFNELKQL